MNPQYIYSGNSWAVRSFETTDGTETDFTNLALEWQIPYLDMAVKSQNNQQAIDRLERLQPHKINIPIIFVVSEPLMDVETTVLNTKKQGKEFLLTNSIHDFRNTLLQISLNQLNQLGVPVGLIGGHSDIMPEQITGYENISIIDSQWQQFLSDRSTNKIINGWGADIAKRIERNPHLINITPTTHLVDTISKQFVAWKEIEHHNLFTYCHPSRLGNELYAAHIKDKVIRFIKSNTGDYNTK
ncbi:hypothetical protein N9R43_00455 [bacterium]|nr:hypothetical protein [bacterium]